MFGECHAHIIMDGVNYRHAVDMHKNGPDDKIIREHLEAYQKRGITFVRDGGDYWEFPGVQRSWHRSMELITGHLYLPYIRKDIMALLWEKVLIPWENSIGEFWRQRHRELILSKS